MGGEGEGKFQYKKTKGGFSRYLLSSADTSYPSISIREAYARVKMEATGA